MTGVDVLWRADVGEEYGFEARAERCLGPKTLSFLIEFDHTQSDPNHIDAAWRDFNGHFGRDLLREHLEQTQH